MYVSFSVFCLTGLLSAISPAPEIGDTLPAKAKVVEKNGSTIVVAADSAQLWPAYQLEINGIVYVVGINSHGKIAYICPDHTFKTKEGISVGTLLSTVTAINPQNKVNERIGWAYYVHLPSGWNAAFITSSSNPTAGLSPDSKVAFLFKSDWAKTSE
jgi:hypothetical protein